jgi:hypothetical protein
MNIVIKRAKLDALDVYWKACAGLRWPLFVSPPWLKVWFNSFGSGYEPYVVAARSGQKVVGIATLLLHDETASLMGNKDVCDYLDFITASGYEAEFCTALMADLKSVGIKKLDLGALRPDSVAHSVLVPLLRAPECVEEDVSPDMDLPSSWDAYFEKLVARQRHELRRKLRRLSAAGNMDYRWLKTPPEIEASMNKFIELFALSQEEKAGFMTPEMESFFRSMARSMSQAGILRLGMLELDTVVLAMVMGFDYGDTFYLYNSAYDPRYNYLSAGLLSKALSIKECIENQKKRYDFLKGNEGYKADLGGKAVTLYRCRANLE